MQILYNTMQQPVRHMGQLSKGDMVSCSSGWPNPDFKVIELKGKKGIISLAGPRIMKFEILFTKINGWYAERILNI